VKSRIVIFGEVLFDRFPDGNVVLGGAPFNVAWNLQALGGSPLFVSCIGQDPLGEQVQELMAEWGMDLSGLQKDPNHPTGVVDVSFINHEPHYEIVYPCAYDTIQIEALPEIPIDSVVYHGTLALRDRVSAATLRHIKEISPESVFIDVNLRNPWWETVETHRLLRTGKWVKLNQDELFHLFPHGKDTHEKITQLRSQANYDAVILTKGKEGAKIFNKTGECVQSSPPEVTSIVDTVGAGDAFASVMLLGFVSGWTLEQSLQRALEFASAIVGIQGATALDKSFYEYFSSAWK
jgi:fructokinase